MRFDVALLGEQNPAPQSHNLLDGTQEECAGADSRVAHPDLLQGINESVGGNIGEWVMLISGAYGFLAKGVQRTLANAGFVSQVAVQGLAAHELDYLPRRVVGAGVVTLIALVKVFEDPAQQLWVGVHGLVVRCRLPGG